ncbi:MAG: SPOR domain-containing protein, partial [Betaproteobacteria bacterium]
PTIAPAIKPREIWWLQVAALGKDEDARRLRARVLLLNLDVVIVPPSPATGSLYRVRVGPYKTEALARAKEGILMYNNLTPRIIKEPVFSP